jgi:diguanylate cyclase (GGDEF)-like protein
MLPFGRLVLFVLLALIAPLSVAVGFSRADTPGAALAALVVPPFCGTLILLILVIRLVLVAREARRRADELGERSASLARALSKQDELQRQLAYRALHDPLTGLANRDVLIDRMERTREATGGAADSSGRGQALMMVDLDGFKDVNDTLGHPMGDQLLIDVAQRLIGAAPEATVVARLGGDEFAVLLEDTPPDDSRRAAEAIREALQTPYFVAGREVFMSASIGLLVTEPGAPPPGSSDGLRKADEALYDAKEAGRDRVVEFRPEPLAEQMPRVSMTADLRQAVSREEFVLHYQPMVGLDDGRPVGMEALIRWRRGGGELVAPSRFLPLAEQTGVITEMGAWVVRQACRDAHRWYADHAVTVGVNVSLRQLNDPTFAETVLSTLAETGLPGSALVLELTESSLIASLADRGMRIQLDRLRGENIRIAIDDFGTGDSSLPRIARLPVDLVKIDSSLSQRPAGSAAPRPDQDWSQVRATLEVVSDLNLPAVAEGIETGAQADTLRQLGCPYGQGYYFSPPVPADRVEGLLREPVGAQPR